MFCLAFQIKLERMYSRFKWLRIEMEMYQQIAARVKGEGCETCYDVYFGDSGTDERQEVTGGGRVEDFHWKKNRTNKIRDECIRGTAQHEYFGDKVKRAKAEMVCPRAEEG